MTQRAGANEGPARDAGTIWIGSVLRTVTFPTADAAAARAATG